jgi:hypothetical protein
MTNVILCALENCNEEAFSNIYYLEQRDGMNKGWRCLKHVKELGDFDQKGRLADRRIKRNG